MTAPAFATRLRTVEDASCSAARTFASLQHLVGVATARFQVQIEVARDCAQDLGLLDAQLGEFLARRPQMDAADAAFLRRAGGVIRMLRDKLDGASR